MMMFIVSSKVILVKRESTSRLAMNRLEFWFKMSCEIESETQVESFKNCMNICHPKMKFTFKKEQNNCFNFLNVEVIREDNVFTISVYSKPSFSSVYMDFDSYMPLNYNFSLAPEDFSVLTKSSCNFKLDI